MKGTKKNDTTAPAATKVEETNVENLAGTDVTPDNAPASAEAIQRLTGAGAREIQGNAIQEKRGYPLFDDDKAQVPMGERSEYHCSCPIYLPIGGEYVEGYLKVNFFGAESPKIGVGIRSETRDPFTRKVEESTSWRNYALSPAQERNWSEFTSSKAMLAYVTALILTNHLEVLKAPNFRPKKR